MTRIFRFGVIAALALPPVLAAMGPAYAATGRPFVVLASGLENPRGLKFGPDGELYVPKVGAAAAARDGGIEKVIDASRSSERRGLAPGHQDLD